MKNINKDEELTEKILKGLKESYRRLVEKSKGTDLIVSRDGKIIRINPNDIKL